MSGALQMVWTASLSGSIVILAVLGLRLVLKKAPKRLICLLWLLAFLRLAVPVTLESPVSLQPDLSGVALTGDRIQAEQPADREETGGDTQTALPVETGLDWLEIAAGAWLAGIAALCACGLWQFRQMKRRVREAVPEQDGCYVTGTVDTAFVLGLFRPNIYLPQGLPERERSCIVAHEKAHIARGDHWLKLMCYGVLILHWFNPLAWLAYSCLSRELEGACDERVIRDMDLAQRKIYSHALLVCAGGSKKVTPVVAFGEGSMKHRILHVLNYRKPGVWVTALTLAAVVFVSVFLMTSPVQAQSPVAGQQCQARCQDPSCPDPSGCLQPGCTDPAHCHKYRDGSCGCAVCDPAGSCPGADICPNETCPNHSAESGHHGQGHGHHH